MKHKKGTNQVDKVSGGNCKYICTRNNSWTLAFQQGLSFCYGLKGLSPQLFVVLGILLGQNFASRLGRYEYRPITTLQQREFFQLSLELIYVGNWIHGWCRIGSYFYKAVMEEQANGGWSRDRDDFELLGSDGADEFLHLRARFRIVINRKLIGLSSDVGGFGSKTSRRVEY